MHLVENGTEFDEEIEIGVKNGIEKFKVPAHNDMEGAEFLNDFNSVCSLIGCKVCGHDFKPCVICMDSFLRAMIHVPLRGSFAGRLLSHGNTTQMTNWTFLCPGSCNRSCVLTPWVTSPQDSRVLEKWIITSSSSICIVSTQSTFLPLSFMFTRVWVRWRCPCRMSATSPDWYRVFQSLSKWKRTSSWYEILQEASCVDVLCHWPNNHWRW